MNLRFTKMQGCGNDYIYVDGFAEQIDTDKKPELVRKLSDRHFGIGGDGVIFINPLLFIFSVILGHFPSESLSLQRNES